VFFAPRAALSLLRIGLAGLIKLIFAPRTDTRFLTCWFAYILHYCAYDRVDADQLLCRTQPSSAFFG
jgi:hypothetical protein